MSSTCLFKLPSVFCWRRKYCCERFRNGRITNSDNGRLTNATTVNSGLIVNIIIVIPNKSTTERINCVILCCRVLQFIRRSEEHTSELQSRLELVCPLLLDNKNQN